jgi:hypothetical protein
MGCFLLQKGIEFVNNFVAQTTKSVHNINRCLGVSWVDDNVYVSGSDSSGIINILDSNGQYKRQLVLHVQLTQIVS